VGPVTARWFERHTEELYLSAITVAEVETGIAKLRRVGSPRRADDLREWFDRILNFYGDRVLAFDIAAARIAGALGDSAVVAGRYPGFADVAIAAIATAHELTILTRNLRHFEALRVAAHDPFEPA
jgi:predicted nucleic acid-binding protein